MCLASRDGVRIPRERTCHANWFTPPLYDIDNSDAYPPDGTGKLGNCYSCHKKKRRSWSQ
ncbi:MAG: hypothetical protein ABIJ09_13240 [Pseudomonadota bacterium]